MSEASTDLKSVIDSAMLKLGADKYHTIAQIYAEIQKLQSNESQENIEEYINNNESYIKKGESKEGEDSHSEISYKMKKLPALVLVGNSPNLIERYNAGAEWSRLLQSMEEICAPYLGCTHRLTSFPQRMQAICNLYKLRCSLNPSTADPIEDALNEWFKAVENLRPTPIHRMLAEMKFDYYLTTNYDYALERIIEKNFKEKQKDCENKPELLFTSSTADGSDDDKEDAPKVIHIHGRVDKISNIVMLPRSYVNAVKTKCDKDKPDWLKKFCEMEVHICGLNLSPEETLVWHALETRLQHLLEKKKDIKSSYPRAYVYLFFKETDDNDKSDYHDKCAMRDLLRTYAVNTILIPVRNNDYIQAWKLLIGEMLLVKNGCRLQYEQEDQISNSEDDPTRLNEELEKALKKTEFGGGRLASRISNMSTAFVAHYKYPYHCWLSMGSRKAGLVKKSGKWLCYCKVDSVRHMYYFFFNSGIKEYLENINNKRHFLLDYYTGALYAVRDDNEMVFIDFGHEITDLDQFCRLIYSEAKQEKGKAVRE